MTSHGVARYTITPTPTKAAGKRRKRKRDGRAGIRALIRWYNRGGEGRWVWGQPGDMTACHLEASRHMSSERAWGFCNRRHRDVTGRWHKPDKK